jgi:pimeloyl-ACP methyl ester carboxylesterase
MQIVVDSLLVSYDEAGGKNKQVMLCLHGWGDDRRTFAGLTAAFKADYNVIALDLPGFGTSQAPPDVWGLEEYAHFVAKFLKKLGISEVDTLVAHSNGAAVAIVAIAAGQLAPKHFVILGGAGIRDQEKAKKLGLKAVAKVGKTMTFWLPASKKKSLQKKLYGAAGSDMLAVPHLQETFKKTVSQDVQADARKIDVPTLLIYGESDRATPPMYGEIYQRLIPNSQLQVIADAEHFVHHDQAAKVHTLIKEFLA